MISLPTQSWLSGMADLTRRSRILDRVSEGEVFQIIRKNGGNSLSALRLSQKPLRVWLSNSGGGPGRMDMGAGLRCEV